MHPRARWLVPLLLLACGTTLSETTETAGDTTGPGTDASTSSSSSTTAEPTTVAPDETTGTTTEVTTSGTTLAEPTTNPTDPTESTDSATDTTTGAVDPPASLEDIVDGELEMIADGHQFTEGPAWSPEGYLLYTDIPANRIYRWTEGEGSSVFIEPSGNANGLAFDAMGRLLAAEHGGRRISRRVIGEDDAETLVDTFEGAKLNSPNDLVLRSDGTIYFTDPPYGIQPNQQEQDFQGVFRVDPQGEISLVAEDFDRPNGIVLSPDETRLYVADTAAEHVRVFAVMPDGSTTGGEVFVDLQSDLQGDPDGMAMDVFGDLYVTGGGGVRVVTPAGEVLGTIEVPQGVTNCTFGDPDGMSLYLTAPPNVYRIRLKVKGHGLP